jgi:hypothetical protein
METEMPSALWIGGQRRDARTMPCFRALSATVVSTMPAGDQVADRPA